MRLAACEARDPKIKLQSRLTPDNVEIIIVASIDASTADEMELQRSEDCSLPMNGTTSGEVRKLGSLMQGRQ